MEVECLKCKNCNVWLDKYNNGFNPIICTVYFRSTFFNYTECKTDCPIRIEIENKLEINKKD